MTQLPRSRTAHVRVSSNPDGGLLVYDLQEDAGHVLNPSVGLVYELADGTQTVRDMAELLPQRVGLPADEEIVKLALQELENAGLLEDASETAAETAYISRRQLMSRLALTAGAVALLPMLDSVRGLSKAAAQDSGVGTSSSVLTADDAYAA